MHRLTRRGFLAAAGAASLAGCVGSQGRSDAGSTASDSRTPTPTHTPSSGSGAGTPPVADRTLPLPLSPDSLRAKVVSGGPPKDGIPSIDEPKFDDVAAGDEWLAGNDIVFGIVRNGQAKAYPQKILVWHEICNDSVGGDPISVTYCPLTGTVLGFERGGTTFGVSGRLVNNNLVMYDRATERWWPQVLSTAIPSPWYTREYARTSLRDLRLVWTTWDRWTALHPDTLVLNEDTGFARNYGRDPYGYYAYPEKGGYYAPDAAPMFQSMSDDDRFPPKAVVIGARTPAGAVAFHKDALAKRGVVSGELAGSPVLGVYDPRLDSGYVYRNPERESFSLEDEAVVSAGGTAYDPDSLPLERIHAFDAMWFAWSGFYPETNVYA